MLEKVVESVYITGGLVLALMVVMAMSSCSSGKMYHVGTNVELSKSRCTGKYIHQ